MTRDGLSDSKLLPLARYWNSLTGLPVALAICKATALRASLKRVRLEGSEPGVELGGVVVEGAVLLSFSSREVDIPSAHWTGRS